MKLEQIINYLPFGLRGYIRDFGRIQYDALYTLIGLPLGENNNEIHLSYSNVTVIDRLENFVPLLYPLSDYSKFDEILNEMTEYEVNMIDENPDMVNRLPHEVILLMYKNHIDVNGLISQNLALEKIFWD